MRKSQNFCHSLLEQTTDQCILWPYSRNPRGYGQLWVATPYRYKTEAHRYMCLIAHGLPSEEKPHALHYCGNPSCINPRHLRWGDPVENAFDKRRHGTHICGEKSALSRLAEQQVNEIRILLLEREVPIHEIARRFNIGSPTISMIKLGKAWKDKDFPPLMPSSRGEDSVNSKLMGEQVLQIRAYFAEGSFNQRQLAVMFGVAFQTINKIVHRRSWKHLP